MKHIYVLIFFLFCISVTQAQVEIKVSQQEKQMSHGMRNGFATDVPQAKLKTVVNAWKKYVKRGEAVSSVEKVEEEYTVTASALTNISSKPMNVYATIKEVESAIRITAFF